MSAKANVRYWPSIDPQLWEECREEFGLLTLDECVQHFKALSDHSEPSMQQLVRVFVDDETLAPGYQFMEPGILNADVLSLFRRPMELKIPHNSFTHWMLTPLPGRNAPRPVAVLDHRDPLMQYLEDFARDRT
ncbi:hypothetical protein AB0284_20315 [Pseudarthrobacter phenanthrenivorans]|uniref:hypothetical protein n=1 Tax=Pseudarthrobacter phenanthrenivorans TaxID=361575 RepID=UPI00344EC272